MQQQEQRDPKGPTTGPMRPLIVVMETTAEYEDPLRPDPSGQPSPPQQGDEQDRLPPLLQEEEQDPAAAVPPQEAPDGPEPPPPPQREPKPLPLPVGAARAQPPFLIAATLGISVILLGVGMGILLAVNPTSLGPMIAWLPGITPTASVTLTPMHQSLHTSVPI